MNKKKFLSVVVLTLGCAWLAVGLGKFPVSSATAGVSQEPGTPVWVWSGGGILYDIHFHDQYGWLSGWYGALGHTTDGGLHWEGQYGGQSDMPFTAVFGASASQAWALGDTGNGGAIYVTSDAGGHWAVQDQSPFWDFNPAGYPGALFFANSQTGWAAGFDNETGGCLLLHTFDGGMNWKKQPCAAQAALHGVYFADESHGWAVGDGGTVLHTTNGGETWTPQEIKTSDLLLDVYALSSKDAWLTGSNWSQSETATIWRTSDGGTNWIKANQTPQVSTLHQVQMTSAGAGWAVGEGGAILSSADFGVTWTAQASGVPYGYTLYGLHFLDATTGFAVGQACLLSTTNGGKTWTPWSPIATLRGVDFPDKNTGWVAGGDGALASTTSGGTRWTVGTLPGTPDLEDVAFGDPLHGFLADRDGEIHYTTDGGAVWKTASITTSTVDFYALAAWDATHAWAGGTKYIYGTTNGANWSRQAETMHYFFGLDFASATAGWAVGETSGGYGTVYITQDGSTWEPQWQYISPLGLRAVAFVSPLVGWAVGEGAAPLPALIRHTTDGGKTWLDQSIPGMYQDLFGIVFVSSSSGWAVGAGGTILHTTDGGANWAYEPATSRAILFDVATDGEQIWAVGTEGTILRRILYLPPAPSPTSSPSATSTSTSTPSPSATPTSTSTPSPSATSTSTSTPSPTLDPGACPDPYEPNESFASAWAIGTGDTHAYICRPTDLDYFKITLLAYQPVQLQLSNLLKDYNLRLFAPDGRQIYHATHPGTTPEMVWFNTEQIGGEYRLMVYGVAGQFDNLHPYKLTIQTGPTPTPPPTATPVTPTPVPTCAPDSYEPNDTSGDAAWIPVNTQIAAYICPALDFDYFTFDAASGDAFQVQLYDLPKAYILSLYDPDGSLVARAGDASRTARAITHRALTGGAYSIKITRAAPHAWDPADPYHLRVDLTANPPVSLHAVDDTFIMSEFPAENYGSEPHILISQDEFLNQAYGLFRFDLTRLPATPVYQAVLLLRLIDESGHGAPEIALRKLTGAWDEETVTWDTRPSSTAHTSAAVGTSTGYQYTWDVTTLVQDWLSGRAPNYGLELRLASPGSYTRLFRSAEYGTGLIGFGSTGSPRLYITYGSEGSGTGALSGVVFHDANRNRRRDPGEGGVGDASLELFRDQVFAGRTTSSATGAFAFDALLPGDYAVVLDPWHFPANYEVIGFNDAFRTLTAGETAADLAFGVDLIPTPTPTPVPSLDLEAAGLELVQVVQGVRLVQNRWTLARLYVSVTGTAAEVLDVDGRLFNGPGPGITPLGTANLLPDSDPMNNPAIVNDLSRTINFLLPIHWTLNDEEDFIAWVNHADWWRECPTCWDSENQIYAEFNFYDRAPLNVTYIEVIVDGVVPTDNPNRVAQWIRKSYPLNRVNIYSNTASPLEVDYDFTITSTSGCGSAWTSLLEDLDHIDRWTLDEWSYSNMKYYGYMDHSVPHGYGGCGWTPGETAAGFVNPANEGGGRTQAHELGHNLNRQHVNCTGTEGNPDPAYPHAGGLIGVYGIDLSSPYTPDLKDPTTHADIMSYCGRRWISDYTYNALWGAFTPAASAALVLPQSHAPDQMYLAVSGHIQGDIVEVSPFFQQVHPAGTSDSAWRSLIAGAYSIELQDAAGTALFTRSFDLIQSIDAEGTLPAWLPSIRPFQIPTEGYFNELLPWQTATSRIVIKRGTTPLYVQNVSPHAPQVDLQTPLPGDAWDGYGTYEITWKAEDDDNDPLWFTLQYSPDGGATWHLVVENLVGQSYLLDAARLPGGDNARLRLFASDGVHTALAVMAGSFTVEDKAPLPLILSPAPGSAHHPGSPILLEGTATDREDGPMNGAHPSFAWYSNRAGYLGSGEFILVDTLTPGFHTLRLEVSDSQANLATAEVVVFIGYRVYLPAIVR